MSRQPASVMSADESLAKDSPRRSAAAIVPGGTGLFIALSTLALILHGSSALSPLPACQADVTATALADALDAIPALQGKNARLIALEQVATRGHNGSRRMRACQARLVTSIGSGRLEYSISKSDSRWRAYRVKPELFQGGWLDTLQDPSSAPSAESHAYRTN